VGCLAFTDEDVKGAFEWWWGVAGGWTFERHSEAGRLTGTGVLVGVMAAC